MDQDSKQLWGFGEEGKNIWEVKRRGRNPPIYRPIAEKFRRENRPPFERSVGGIFKGQSDVRTNC